MLRSAFLRQACALSFQPHARNGVSSSAATKSLRPAFPCRPLCSYVKGAERESPLPIPAPLTPEEIEFVEDLAGSVAAGFNQDVLPETESTALPEAPELSADWDVVCDEPVDDNDEVVDLEAVPFSPPRAFEKFDMLTGNILEEKPSQNLSLSQLGLLPTDFENNPKIQEAIAAWARAVMPTPATGPMPLHELANRSTKIKELVKLGVDFSKIAKKHGDLERLLHLDWEGQIKPQIRFLVDCGIEPENLASHFTNNTPLLWTDQDDIQVRINYLEAKCFTQQEIKFILNKAPNWLTLPTKELDSRLGFIQRTFKLGGSEVRCIASSFPGTISARNKKWTAFVDTTKLMDREFGFNPWERKELLIKKANCYTRPALVRAAFNFCHHQVGLTHTQLVKHASLLVSRVATMKPRHEFLKFLKRDIFDTAAPLYVSPDWLWQGTTEDFCHQAAKSTVEEYDNFLKYSTVI